MFHDTLRLPVPLTVRPIAMLGGGGASSKGHADGGHHDRSQRTLTTMSTGTASPNGMAMPTTASAAEKDSTPLNRPTITIFTELDDGADDVTAAASAAPVPPRSSSNMAINNCTSGSGKRAPMSVFRDPSMSTSQRPPTALDHTETVLTPLHYRSLCSHPGGGDDSAPFSNAFDPMTTAAAQSSPSIAGADGPLFGQQTTEGASGAVEQRPPGSLLLGFSAHATAPTSSFISLEPSQPSALCPSIGDVTPPDPHPVRLSATPVVPIVPHVAEPSSRRRVAEDLDRLYGSSSRRSNGGASAAATDTTTEVAATSTSLSAAEPAALLAAGPAKKAKSGFFSSTAAKKAERAEKAAKAAEAKKKAAPPTAAERRQAREQVIRVGVQRLYQRLNELHLVVYHVKSDGNCQFRAISHQLFGNEIYHDIIRSQVVSYMRAARAESFDFYFESSTHADAYYDNLAKLGSWGDELSLRAASDCLYVNIHVLSSEEQNCYITYQPSLERAATAPSFLVDIAKLQERRRAERRLLRTHGLRGSNSSHASFDHSHADVTPQLRTSGGDYGGFGRAATMPDTYGRGRYSEPAAAANPGARTLLVPYYGGSSATARPGLPSAPMGSRPISCDASSFMGEEVDDDDSDVAAANVHAIQLALHEKLQQSEIRCSLPFGATSTCSLGPNAGMAGGGGGGGASMQLLRPMQEPVPVPRLASGDEDTSQRPENQMERFRAVGAEVQPLNEATQSVNIFTQRMESLPAGVPEIRDYLRPRQHAGARAGEMPSTLLKQQQQHVRPTLLQPQRGDVHGGGLARNRPEPLLTAASVPYMYPPPAPHAHEEDGEMMLFASSSHKGGNRASRSLQQSFSFMTSANSFGGYAGGSAYAGSFNTNPAQGSFSHSFAGGGGNGGAYAQSLGNLVPIPAGYGSSLPYGATGAGGGDAGVGVEGAEGQGRPVGFFKFEPRTEAIDIFLSYLYPVHYNSLSVSTEQPQPQQQSAMNASTASATTPAAASVAGQGSPDIASAHHLA